MSDLQLEKPLRRGDENGQVKLVQEWLCLQGEHVAIDGDFGPATESAVKDFQMKSSLAARGIVDAVTFGHLIAPMTAALAPIAVSGRSLGELVVAYAAQHLRQHPREIGGQNKGPWVRLYMDGHDGAEWAWCAGFACFCLKRACETLAEKIPIEPSFGCDELAKSARENGRLVDHSAAGPGSFFLFRKSAGDWTHTGIVVSTSEETFRTIEGNTNDDGSREGYEVCARIRSYKNMDFIRI